MTHDELDFDGWYASQHPRVLVAVAVMFNGDIASAEDATNDAFVKAYERWDSVARMESPAGWVTNVAINSAKRSFRRRKRRIELLNAQRLETISDDRYRDFDLWASLNKLSFRQREAIVLRYIADMPQAAVADELGIATGTASATLSQARGLLRTHMTTGEERD